QLVPNRAAVRSLVDAVALESGVEDVQVAGRVADDVDVTAIGIEDDVGGLPGAHLLPVVAAVDAAPDTAVGAGQGGVDDNLAAGSRAGVDHDLERMRADEDVVAHGRVQRQDIAQAVHVGRAIEQSPGGATVHGAQEADSLGAGVALAGAGEDDGLARIMVAAKDIQPANVDAEGRTEIGK